jgi:hypothetical protein
MTPGGAVGETMGWDPRQLHVKPELNPIPLYFDIMSFMWWLIVGCHRWNAPPCKR